MATKKLYTLFAFMIIRVLLHKATMQRSETDTALLVARL